ncbi:hypothetical protein [Aureibaculum conchae]|uniref:hypothetical protein n=1 Tax=Aureibaculum sp. 2308TA14-22 TaxID=3108392 RepID=UPI00339642E7
MNNLKFLNSKIKYSFLLYLAATSLLISCQDQKPRHENQKPTKEMLAHIIKTEKAVEIYKNYEEQRLNILKDTLQAIYKDENFNDTRRVWFDLKTLKNYIAYVEKRSAENDITPEGLQFYFSVYGDDEGKQKNHQTFFIAPTTENKGKQSGYTLETIDDKTQPLFLKTILSSGRYTPSQNQQMDKAGFFSLTTLDGDEGLLYNKSQGSPPN